MLNMNVQGNIQSHTVTSPIKSSWSKWFHFTYNDFRSYVDVIGIYLKSNLVLFTLDAQAQAYDFEMK